MAVKYVPTRQCVICRRQVPKPELIRFVVMDDKVIIDPTGRMNGRGAYLCSSVACREKAKKTNALSRHLKRPVEDQVWTTLETMGDA